jgi:hypothetical protein
MVGFRSTTPLLTGNTQVAAMGLPSIPSVNPGFRMGNTNMPLPGLGFRAGPSVGGGITGTFGGGIDPNIFANYKPTYIPIPQTYYNPSIGRYEHDGKEIIDDRIPGLQKGPNSSVDIGVGGDYVTASEILGPPPKESYGHPGVSDNQKGGGGGNYGSYKDLSGSPHDNTGGGGGGGRSGSSSGSGRGGPPGAGGSGYSTGGRVQTSRQIPPVYANQGEVMPDYEDIERRERERKEAIAAKATAKEEAKFKDVVDAASRGLGFASLFGNEVAGKVSPYLAALNFGTSVAQGTVTEDYIDPIKDNFNKYVYNPISDFFKDEIIDPASYNRTDYSGYTGNTKGRSEDITIYGAIPGDYSPPKTSGITRDYSSTSTDPAFDYSPGNINPSTGQTMTPQTDTIPGGTRPNVNVSRYSPVDYESDFFADLQAEIAAFDANFKDEQEAKQKALEDAAKASAAAAYSDSTWGGGYDKEAYDRGGWGPDVGGYNDPGAFGGSMGSSPGDKSTW